MKIKVPTFTNECGERILFTNLAKKKYPDLFWNRIEKEFSWDYQGLIISGKVMKLRDFEKCLNNPAYYGSHS